MGDNSATTTAPSPAKTAAVEDALLKQFFAEVSEVERDNEVNRILSCFKLNPFDYLNLSFDSSIDEVKKQYRKLSLLVHPDKCKHPQAKEAFGGKEVALPFCATLYSIYFRWFFE
ncbi:PREDICTED: J domain-containing protein spf31-like [Nicotiana attenuata]|uniref:J domain-containing protein spf31-like n=1 Tax=Nicotiana attenuata TaxID=49451 RepID=UPI000904DA48|nr:PREDICTED: J domain-containing protein spf31-like [Nicotiana attenuata]